jgi:hypothetical protein
MKYANVINGEIAEQLPTVIIAPGGTTVGPTLAQLQAVGWRKVVEIKEPSFGCRATSYTPQEINATTARLMVAGEANLAAEAANKVASQKAAARDLLESTDGLGRLLLTICEELVKTINVERSQHGRAAITSAQIVATIKAALQ